jgi:hypothetical protein
VLTEEVEVLTEEVEVLTEEVEVQIGLITLLEEKHLILLKELEKDVVMLELNVALIKQVEHVQV